MARRYLFGAVTGLFLISRFLFLSNYPHFYDSPEYWQQSWGSSFRSALRLTHESVHPVSLWFNQQAQRIYLSVAGVLKLAPSPQVWPLSFMAAVFGLIGFLAFYNLGKRLFGEKVALLSLLSIVFFPQLWLLQTNVFHESCEHSFFWLGILGFDLYLEKRKKPWLIMGILFLALSVTNYVGFVVWFPALIGLVIYRSRNRQETIAALFFTLKVIFAAGLLALLFLVLFLAAAGIDPMSRIVSLLSGPGLGGSLWSWQDLTDFGRMARNAVLILWWGYSTGSFIIVILTLKEIFKEKNWRLLALFVAFGLPFFLTARLWYGGLFGRCSGLIGYPLAWMWGRLSPKPTAFLSVILIAFFLSTIWAYQQEPIPLIQKEIIKSLNLQKDDLIVFSDYQRPQLFFDQGLYLSSSAASQRQIELQVNLALAKKRRVFVTHQAITFPYWQYDGQQLHIISRGNSQKALLFDFWQGKSMKIVAANKDYPLLTVFQLE